MQYKPCCILIQFPVYTEHWQGALKNGTITWLNETFPIFYEAKSKIEEIKANFTHKKENVEDWADEKRNNFTSMHHLMFCFHV